MPSYGPIDIPPHDATGWILLIAIIVLVIYALMLLYRYYLFGKTLQEPIKPGSWSEEAWITYLQDKQGYSGGYSPIDVYYDLGVLRYVISTDVE